MFQFIVLVALVQNARSRIRTQEYVWCVQYVQYLPRNDSSKVTERREERFT